MYPNLEALVGKKFSVPSIGISEQAPLVVQEKQSTDYGVKQSTPLNYKPKSTSLRSYDQRSTVKCKIFGFWASSEEITKVWKKMSKDSQGNWNGVTLVTGSDYDVAIVVNCPPLNEFIDCKKCILVRMEPNMEKHELQWGEWANPDSSAFLHVFRHEESYNNLEWHVGKTYTELLNQNEIQKDPKLDYSISTVLSGKYNDPGHIKRIDFTKFLEKKFTSVIVREEPKDASEGSENKSSSLFSIDVFGTNRFHYVNYKGELPYHQKDNALFPYKYTFNCENNSIKNYVTEKLIDGILTETLVFYSGCPNIREIIDEKAYVYLELSNFEKDYNIIKTAIEENWWEQRLPYIRKAKKKILNDLQFFPRIEKVLIERRILTSSEKQ